MRKLKSEDLRIGNIVLDSTKNTTVVETIIPEHKRARYGKPLNKKWVLAMGFKQYSDETDTFEIYDCVISFSEKKIWISQDRMKELTINIVPFVHQFQNLYYILTGNELVK